MFLDFYKIRTQPFGVTPDPRFLYLGKNHREALASLYYAVESDCAFAALIAQPGLGKTTLTFQFLEKLRPDSRTVLLSQTQCNSKDLIHYLLDALGVDAQGLDLVSMHNKLNQILCRERLAGRRFILAIDEAQNLDLEVLETIRLLSNFETAQTKMLQIVLIGRPQLARKLASPELEQLHERISVFASLEPLGPDDTIRYISHRLQVAGYEGDPLFTPGALRIVVDQSQGIPRRINSLCFSALSLACALGRKQVDAAMMEEVVADRDVESLQRPRVPRRTEFVTATPRTKFPVNLAAAKRIFGRWAQAASGAAIILALGAGFFPLFPTRIVRSIQKSTEALASVRNAGAPIRDFIDAKSNSLPDPASLNVQTANLPVSEAAQIPASIDKDGVQTVVVHPGETLQTIILRTLGVYDDVTVQQVQRLNPAISDFNNVEAGQAIRLPRILTANDSVFAGKGDAAAGKN